MATEALELRLARLEGGFEQVDHRLASLEETLRTQGARIDALGESLSGRIDAQGARMESLEESLGRRIDALGETLGRRIDSLAGRMDSLDGRVQSLGGRIDTVVFWVAGFIVTSLAGLATSLVIFLLRP